jgi:predicted transcriptional regulator
MEIPLSHDLQAKLSRLAAQQGRPTAALATEAIERMVNHDEWFLSEVQKALLPQIAENLKITTKFGS